MKYYYRSRDLSWFRQDNHGSRDPALSDHLTPSHLTLSTTPFTSIHLLHYACNSYRRSSQAHHLTVWLLCELYKSFIHDLRVRGNIDFTDPRSCSSLHGHPLASFALSHLLWLSLVCYLIENHDAITVDFRSCVKSQQQLPVATREVRQRLVASEVRSCQAHYFAFAWSREVASWLPYP